MQSRQKQSIEAYLRVKDFLEQNPLPPPGSYGAPKEILDEVVARLTDHGNAQATGGRLSKADAQLQKTLRAELREQHLKPINKIAKATLRGSPAIDKALKLPKPQRATTLLLADASAFRTAGQLYEATFVKNGRPADFLEKLDGMIARLRQSMVGQGRNVGSKVGGKQGLKDEIVRGRDAVEMLDAIVSTTFVGQGVVLAKWENAKRIRSTSGGGRTPAPATTVAAAAPVASTKVA
jgi:hypothetical protein